MSGMLSGVLLIAAFALAAGAALVLVVALFRVTRPPAAEAPRGSGPQAGGSADV